MMVLSPRVSVIVPCRNEARFIANCVRSILSSDYPTDRLELIVADGMSTDDTRRILEAIEAEDSRLKVVDNPSGTTPAALNRAIAAANGAIIVRVDAHSKISPQYVRACVDVLERSAADNVGGIMHTVPRQDGILANGIAAALSHPFGVGNSRFRIHSSEPLWVDTVFGGCYRRETFQRIGMFNEALKRGQDMEFNLRLRRSGGRILLDPSIESWYYPRSDLRSFIAQNWTNGVWAILPFMWSKGNPVTFRHLVPLMFTIVLVVLGLGGVFLPVLWKTLVALMAVYGAGVVIASIHAASRKRELGLLFSLPICFPALHLPYGFGSAAGSILLMWAFITGEKHVAADSIR